MLQNLPEGETDKSYDKTINLRELKKIFRTFVLASGPRPWIQALKTWTQKNLDPEKPGR